MKIEPVHILIGAAVLLVLSKKTHTQTTTDSGYNIHTIDIVNPVNGQVSQHLVGESWHINPITGEAAPNSLEWTRAGEDNQGYALTPIGGIS